MLKRLTRGCVRAQQREGEYSPSKITWPDGSQSTNSFAQQREGEYSPSKRQNHGMSNGTIARSTKGGGIFPLQAETRPRGRDYGRALNKGRGNIPPPRSPTSASPAPPARAQQREGEYSPSKVRHGEAVLEQQTARSTKGGGIFPLQASRSRSVTKRTAYGQKNRSTREMSPIGLARVFGCQGAPWVRTGVTGSKDCLSGSRVQPQELSWHR